MLFDCSTQVIDAKWRSGHNCLSQIWCASGRAADSVEPRPIITPGNREFQAPTALRRSEVGTPVASSRIPFGMGIKSQSSELTQGIRGWVRGSEASLKL